MQNHSSQNSPASSCASTDAQEKTPVPQTQAQNGRGGGGSRGPRPGKYQNGKECFSAWFFTTFMVRLRRYATNLGMDVPTLLKVEYGPRLEGIHLTEDDLKEIEESRKSIQGEA